MLEIFLAIQLFTNALSENIEALGGVNNPQELI